MSQVPAGLACLVLVAVLASSLQFICRLQADVHAAFGGVVPMLAMEAHKAAMDSCVSDALKQAGVQEQDLHAVAVSIGPGLSPCLQVSCSRPVDCDNTPGLLKGWTLWMLT